MDYERIYREFIADRRAREVGLTGYTEKHHILPRSLGGGNEPENLIRLTAGDHFFAHLLLAKAHGGKLWYALNALMAGHHIGERKADRAFTIRARRYYEQTRAGFAAAHSARMKGVFAGDKHPMYGKPCSPIALEKLKARIAAGDNPMQRPEVRAKVSAALLGRIITPQARAMISAAKMGVKLSDATRAKMSASKMGKSLAPETIAKLVAANRGKKRTPEQVKAMRERLTGRKLSPEHAAKCAAKLKNASRFRGRSHSEDTRARMAAVNEAKKVYSARHGCSPKYVSIPMMRQAGIDI